MSHCGSCHAWYHHFKDIFTIKVLITAYPDTGLSKPPTKIANYSRYLQRSPSLQILSNFHCVLVECSFDLFVEVLILIVDEINRGSIVGCTPSTVLLPLLFPSL
mmetsp:Transcript_273/g.502  ORF Transcript_273/g.502 Transcript_273/m.502 type:complete len:104 (+) Transcript_273:37-348(+)